jgi:hypothetical protein
MAALSACAYNNTGQIDYRVATSDPGAISTCGKSSCVQLDRRYALSGYRDDGPFESDDVYAISIEQLVIGDNISESPYFKAFDKTGEFAILANVFEFASTEADADGRSFLQGSELGDEASTDQRLKLVYYDDGVKPFQPLNFSNIPIVPRTAYKGGSVGIQLVIMELDTEKGPMTSLLTTLARVGQKAIPVSPGVSEVILNLGESLFQGGTYDDRLFEYKFVLANGGQANGNSQPVFAPGRYVLRRQEQRHEAIDWGTTRLDVNTGRLVTDKGLEIRNDLYVVLNVAKYDAATAAEYYDLEGWNEFRQALAAADPLSISLADLEQQLSGKLAEQRSDDWLRKLRLSWSQAEAKLNRYARLASSDTAIDGALATCRSPDATAAKRMRDQAQFVATDALKGFQTAYDEAMAAGNGDEREIDDSDMNALIARVARYFMPWGESGAEQENFADATKFDVYLNGDFRQDALAVAKTRVAAPVCLKSAESQASES